MQGFVEIEKLHAGDLKDEDFRRAKQEGRLHALLDSLPLVQKVSCHNRVFDNMAGYLLDKLFSLPNCGANYYYTDYGPPAALSFIFFLTTDADTDDYEENNGDGYSSPWHPDDACVAVDSYTLNGMARFVEDEIDPFQVWTDPDREAIHFKDTWLYLPEKMVHSNIRSLGIFFQSDADNLTGAYRYMGRIARVRFKDAAGNKVTLTKSNKEVLRVSYQFTLVAV
jgi:hypothetical protein